MLKLMALALTLTLSLSFAASAEEWDHYEVKVSKHGRWLDGDSTIGGPDLCTYDQNTGKLVLKMRKKVYLDGRFAFYEEIKVNGKECDRHYFERSK